MSQKGLANSLKAIIIGLAICGLLIYFYFLPVWGKALIGDFVAYHTVDQRPAVLPCANLWLEGCI